MIKVAHLFKLKQTQACVKKKKKIYCAQAVDHSAPLFLSTSHTLVGGGCALADKTSTVTWKNRSVGIKMETQSVPADEVLNAAKHCQQLASGIRPLVNSGCAYWFRRAPQNDKIQLKFYWKVILAMWQSCIASRKQLLQNSSPVFWLAGTLCCGLWRR